MEKDGQFLQSKVVEKDSMEDKIENQLFYESLGKLIWTRLEKEGIPLPQSVHDQAVEILIAILHVIQDNTLSDFYKVDKIVEILSMYDLDTADCHDF